MEFLFPWLQASRKRVLHWRNSPHFFTYSSSTKSISSVCLKNMWGDLMGQNDSGNEWFLGSDYVRYQSLFTFITKGNPTKVCGSVIMLLDLCYKRIILLNDSIGVKMGFCDDSVVKNLPAMQQMWVQSLGWEDSLEKKMATNFSILAWIIPWTEERGGLHSPWGRKEQDMTKPPPQESRAEIESVAKSQIQQSMKQMITM